MIMKEIQTLKPSNQMQAIPAHFFWFTQEQLKQTAPTNQVNLRNEPALFQLD